MQVQTRKEAQILGQVRYYNGRPCNRGHLSERYTSTGQCVECLHPARKTSTISAGKLTIPDVDLQSLDADYDVLIARSERQLRSDNDDAIARLNFELEVTIRKRREALIDEREAKRAALQKAAAVDEARRSEFAERQRKEEQEQAARQALAATRAEVDVFLRQAKRCKWAVDATKEQQAIEMVWAWAAARCMVITKEDIYAGRATDRPDSSMFFVHPDDVTPLSVAVRAFAPPSRIADDFMHPKTPAPLPGPILPPHLQGVQIKMPDIELIQPGEEGSGIPL